MGDSNWITNERSRRKLQLTAIDPSGNFPELVDMRLACLHWVTVNVEVAALDDPSLPVDCRECGTERQLHPLLQAKMLETILA